MGCGSKSQLLSLTSHAGSPITGPYAILEQMNQGFSFLSEVSLCQKEEHSLNCRSRDSESDFRYPFETENWSQKMAIKLC